MLVYFDNAATSYPKPPQMLEGVKKFTLEVGSNPGRSGHRLSIEGGKIIDETRELLAKLFNIKNPLQIAFTHNASHALNFALLGLLKPKDHVITSSLEHNSIARPLRYLEAKGVRVTQIKADPKTSQIDPEKIKQAITKDTKLVALLHGSNVTGIIFPLEKIGKIVKEAGAYFLVDAAQTAGVYPIDVKKCRIDLLAFTGHKGLLGPQGTGGLYVREGLKLKPTIRGGTGSRSEKDTHPDFMPDTLEVGTQNAFGIAGLRESTRFILKETVKKIRNHEAKLTEKLVSGLKEVDDIKIYGNSQNTKNLLPLVSFNLKGFPPSKVAETLDKKFQIMARAGLHCSPWAHQTIDTYPAGTVRFSLGYFNQEEEIKYAISAIKEILKKR